MCRYRCPQREGHGEGIAALATPQSDSRQAGKPDLRWRDELFPLSCGIAILVLVSSQTGFSAHVRYAIPALPYFFIWCGKLFAERVGSLTNPKRQRGGPIACVPRLRFGLVWASLIGAVYSAVRPTLAWLCLLAAIVESLCVYPHSIAFFNLLIGGPAHGHEWLLDSNGAWGQDLIYLHEWVEHHPEARPLHLATVGWLDPQVLGIDYTLPPHAPRDGDPVSPPALATDRRLSASKNLAGRTP